MVELRKMCKLLISWPDRILARHRGFPRRTCHTFSRGSIAPTGRVLESPGELGSAYRLRNGSPKLIRARSQSQAKSAKGPSFEFRFLCRRTVFNGCGIKPLTP